MPEINFTPSALKHVSKNQIEQTLNSNTRKALDRKGDEIVIGFDDEGSEIEVKYRRLSGDSILVFHAMYYKGYK